MFNRGKKPGRCPLAKVLWESSQFALWRTNWQEILDLALISGRMWPDKIGGPWALNQRRANVSGRWPGVDSTSRVTCHTQFQKWGSSLPRNLNEVRSPGVTFLAQPSRCGGNQEKGSAGESVMPSPVGCDVFWGAAMDFYSGFSPRFTQPVRKMRGVFVCKSGVTAF